MTDNTEAPGLNAAYGLETPDDHLRLYRDWAETYDASFADAHGYIAPAQVAAAFMRAGGTQAQGPVLDVGAGTGLVGQMLKGAGLQVDALDLSPEMLAVAGRKGCYRALIQGDLTTRLDIPDATYDGLISAGTFTHGHLGPEVFDELMRIAKPGALFALGINQAHFAAMGFAAKFQAMGDDICDLTLQTIRLYEPGANGPHANDQGHVAVFYKKTPE